MKKCTFNGMTFAGREVGCPLDHCACGYHIDDPATKDHVCPPEPDPVEDDGTRCACYEDGDAESGPSFHVCQYCTTRQFETLLREQVNE
jgi:hypothetical protein